MKDEICGAGVPHRLGEMACLRRAGHPGEHVSLMCDAEAADASCAQHPDTHCPTCSDAMVPEHAHYKCLKCGFRTSCCF